MAHVPQRIIEKAERRVERRLHRAYAELTLSFPSERNLRLYHQSRDGLLRLLEDRRLAAAFDASDPRSYDPSEGESHDPLPDIPLAMTPDPGDHHVYVRAVAP